MQLRLLQCVCFQHSCCSRPHTPLFLPRKPLLPQLFGFHVSTFLLIISRSYCQISFRPVFKSSLHLVTGATFYVLIPCTLALVYSQGLFVGLSAAFPSGSTQTSEKISSMLLHRTTCSILCSANLTGLATKSEIFW